MASWLWWSDDPPAGGNPGGRGIVFSGGVVGSPSVIGGDARHRPLADKVS